MSPRKQKKSSKLSRRTSMLKPPPASPALWRALNNIRTTSSSHNKLGIVGSPAASPHSIRSPPKPENSIVHSISDFHKSALLKLMFALDNSYTGSTSKNHEYTVKRFVQFAGKCGIKESDALPCDAEMLCMWIADGIGRTGVGTATANIAALSAWHRNRNIPFEIPLKMKTIKRAIKLHWPEEKQQKPIRPPISPSMIRLLTAAWSKGSPRKKCALAIALCAFMGQMRLGELLPVSQDKIARERLPSRGRWSLNTESNEASSIFLPWTKTTGKAGASVTLPPQSHPIDPTTAMCHHLIASPLYDSNLICEYLEEDCVKVLDKESFMKMCNEVWSIEGFPRITGHSFRIGGTTSLLLAGIDTQIVKGMGRWSSDAFKCYWRKVEVLFQKHASKVEWVDFVI
jgi:hypothetical protein